jgi:hypothetical protein
VSAWSQKQCHGMMVLAAAHAHVKRRRGQGPPDICDLSGPAGRAGLEPGFRPISKARPNWAKINDVATKLEILQAEGRIDGYRESKSALQMNTGARKVVHAS